MSLFPCPECSHTCSTKAPSCPNCGMPLEQVASEIKPRKRKWKLLGRLAIALVLVMLFAIYIWPTHYRYDQITLGGGVSIYIRTDRLTGEVEMLTANGWKHMAH